MELGIIFGILATSSLIIAYIIYNRRVARLGCKPAITGWLLGSFISILNAISYLVMTRDIIKAAMPITATLLCVFTTLTIFRKGNFVRMDIYDKITFTIGLLAIFIWWYYQNATFANILLQACFIISMIPMYRSVLRDGRNEPPLPWFLWGLAYCFNTSVVIFRWQGQWPDLANPVIAIIEHTGMGLLALRRKK